MQLLTTAGHVALYDFDVPSRKWSKKDIEGSLFLVKRRGSPRFRLIILNKKSADNYMEDVGGGFDAEVNSPYLLYRNKAGEVVGIWFFEESDCQRVAALIARISSTFAAPSDAVAGAHEPESTTLSASKAATPQTESSFIGTSTNGSGQAEDQEDDGIFWDKKVTVPTDVGMPSTDGIRAPQEEGNLLSKMFGKLKMAPAEKMSEGSMPITTGGPTIPLLTPQFLQQQASTQPAAVEMSSGNAQKDRQGAMLLQSLQGGTSPSAEDVGAPIVSALLKALANNEVFCRELAQEMKRVGFTMSL